MEMVSIFLNDTTEPGGVVVRKFGLGERGGCQHTVSQKGPPFEGGGAIDVEEEAQESRRRGWEERRSRGCDARGPLTCFAGARKVAAARCMYPRGKRAGGGSCSCGAGEDPARHPDVHFRQSHVNGGCETLTACHLEHPVAYKAQSWLRLRKQNQRMSWHFFR